MQFIKTCRQIKVLTKVLFCDHLEAAHATIF